MNPRPREHATDDRLIDLAHGLLEPAEAALCLAHVSGCGPCEERLRAVARERAHLVAEHAPGVARPAMHGAIRAGGVAAAVVAACLIVVALLPSASRTEPQPAAYWLPIDREEAVLRSDGDVDASQDLAQALAAYRGRDVARATELLIEARVSPSHEPVRDLYLASALALGGHFAEAAPVLDRLHVDTLPEPWRARARWIAYSVARATGDSAAAAALLERLAGAAGEVGELARRESDLRRRRAEP